ncbi:glycosyltransferase family 2 protein [Paenibacillus puerhi]|uniref:glycosyltransferase family 2 protein n=1 Tax=Paenibacillus puerhi TaxID=2692622 RepID=UPI00135AF015|nr:glycosyltransferase [Paenibacillus puerhi]
MRRSRKQPKGTTVRRSNTAPSRAARISVIIPVKNERRTLPKVIREARKLSPSRVEIIVVVNGSTDGSRRIAEAMGAKVYAYDEALGHDVGRSVGAHHATGDILVFVDGDTPIPARELRPYIRAVGRGVDIALNRYLGPLRRKWTHPVVLAKHVMNTAIGRPQLKGASMTTIPHAISRRALDIIGVPSLSVPPLAQTMAIHHGLNVRPVHLVPIGRINRWRRRRISRQGVDSVGHLIIGDHLEALHWYLGQMGSRGRYVDAMRARETVR